jgi:hypothetical protein
MQEEKALVDHTKDGYESHRKTYVLTGIEVQ